MRTSSAAAIGLSCLSLAAFLYGLWHRGSPAILYVAVVLVHVVGLLLALVSSGQWQWSEELRQTVPPSGRVGGWTAVLIILGIIAFPLIEVAVVSIEQRTGLFTIAANLLLRGIAGALGLAALVYAASVFFPRSWGLKAGILGAGFALLAAAFFLLLAWGNGRGLSV